MFILYQKILKAIFFILIIILIKINLINYENQSGKLKGHNLQM